MKKIALSFLTLMLALGLCVGCMTINGGSESTPTESSEEVSSSAQGRPSKNSSDNGSEEESDESMESVDYDPYASDIY